MTHIPYTYLIGWSKIDKWYYGVRYATNCDPALFWIVYFTSSDVVKQYRNDYGEPDVIEIRKTFNDAESARIWEHKVLKRLNVQFNDKWLNISTGKAPPIMRGEDNPFFKKNHSDHSRKLMSETKKRNYRKSKIIEINNGVRNAVIYAHQLEEYKKRGWTSGRLIISEIEKIRRPTIEASAEV